MKREFGTRSAEMDIGFINLNTATEKDMAQIPWIGPECAHTLAEHRPFGSIEDVRKVPGITDDIMDELVRGGAMVGDPRPGK